MTNITREGLKNVAIEIINDYAERKYKGCHVYTQTGNLYTAKEYAKIALEVYDMLDFYPDSFESEDDFFQTLESLYTDDVRFFKEVK